MNNNDLNTPDDELPFVNEACGDTMWEDVLAQPGITPAFRTPLPPFTLESALQKVQMAEDAWNSRDPDRVSLAYTVDTEWRNRAEFIRGRDEVKAFLTRKWSTELEYKLKKTLWDFRDNRIAVQFEYEWRNSTGQWFRSYGNELWEFDSNGFMQKRFASINDLLIQPDERRISVS